VKEAIFDGELVVFINGKPNFEKLQEREHVEREERISILSRMIPATYVAFDILYLDGHELMKEPLERRKNILREVIKDECLPYIIESKYVLEQGKRFFEEIKREGLEGVMAKRLNSPYVEGKRTSYWVKIKAKKVAECFICGYTEGEGGRKRSFGAILVGEFDGDRLTYRGSVGTGFDAYELEKLSTLLASIKSETPTLEYFPGGKKISWVKPLLKCKVEFTERTRRGHFRQPSFKGIIE
jgi:DNA ligase D-like protein (predicted ligase)